MKNRNSCLALVLIVMSSVLCSCGAGNSLAQSIIPDIINPGTLGGNVSGLAPNSSVTLTTLVQTVTVNANGSFTFPGKTFGLYNVTVLTQPANQTCVVTNGSGVIIAGQHATNVQVTCSYSYTISGTVSGLSELNTVVLTTNGQLASVLGNGSNEQPFTFLIPIASGTIYNVSILSQPFGETCTVTNATGTINSSNVTNVVVNCS